MLLQLRRYHIRKCTKAPTLQRFQRAIPCRGCQNSIRVSSHSKIPRFLTVYLLLCLKGTCIRVAFQAESNHSLCLDSPTASLITQSRLINPKIPLLTRACTWKQLPFLRTHTFKRSCFSRCRNSSSYMSSHLLHLSKSSCRIGTLSIIWP
jgi:hypothetical protein